MRSRSLPQAARLRSLCFSYIRTHSRMDPTILVVHSQPAVIDDVLDAMGATPHRVVVSTEPSMTGRLCERYQPDLLLIEWAPDRYGGIDGFHDILRRSDHLVAMLFAAPGMSSLPAACLGPAVRGCHSLPVDRDKLRKQVARCLWTTMPQRVLRSLTRDIEERARTLNTFLELSQAITTNLRDDLDTVLQSIAEETSRMLNAERTSLFIYDRARNVLWSRVAEGEGGRTITLSLEEPGIAVHVAKTGQPLRVEDAYREPLFNRDVDRVTGYQTRTILGFPVRNYHGELIGVIETLNKKSGYFDQADERLLSIVSFLFAATIENAQLYEALRRQIRENKTLEAAKLKAERLAIVGQMASSIIHDIRSPLSIIRGYAELAVAGSVTTEKRQRFANTIAGEVHRLHTMARELQEFSEETPHIHPVSTPIGPFFQEIFAALDKNFTDRGIQIVHHLQYSERVTLDPERMRRVVLNIATNAADAMPDGGTFMVTSVRDGDHVLIALQDTGGGIPEEIRDRLFEPFVTAGKKHGTGLGLAIVKRVVEDHGGAIAVNTSPTGTTFTIRLPLDGQTDHETVHHEQPA